ncbi:VPLPA-CTERM sorting domain-containing protein [Sedimentitalea sp. XS_ASV28]|uniref:VPLPA-CTERM sorting domain-containing protein n=1 Tax=Sedimentitalea sp. XS_ASV28 TaxID=3241296 RepID=UPI00351989A3
MTFKLSGLAAAAFVIVASLISPASAATVDASNDVTFQFDLSGVGDASFSSFGYNCNGCSGEGLFESGASVQIDFGTTLGASDIGSRTFTNPFNFAISNVGSGLSPQIEVAGSVETLFMTFRFVDDAFDIFNASISGGGIGTLNGGLVENPVPSPVPLPAGFLLMASAIGGLAFVKRKQASA